MIGKIRQRASTAERASWLLFLACWCSYAIISMSKSAYPAAIASIVQEGIFDKSRAGLINAGFYLFYGAAQLAAGVKIVDRISPVLLVGLSMAGAGIMTLGMAFADSFLAMLILWSAGGLLQFGMYPAILRVLSELLLPEHKSRAMMYISFSYCAGGLMNYLSSAVVLRFANWNMIFIVNAALIALALVLWIAVTRRTTGLLSLRAEETRRAEEKLASREAQKPTQEIGLWRMLMGSGLIFLLGASFVRTALDIGVKAWVPTMITESYAVSASFANALTTVLLLVNLTGVFIAAFIYPKRIKNVSLAFGTCFVAALPMMLLLLLIGKIPVWAVVILLTGITTLMYAGYQYNYVIIPAQFARYNRVGSTASLLNAIASFGAVAANYGFGYLAEHTGWSGTIISWIILAAAAVLFCLLAAPIWRRFTNQE